MRNSNSALSILLRLDELAPGSNQGGPVESDQLCNEKRKDVQQEASSKKQSIDSGQPTLPAKAFFLVLPRL